MGLAERIVVCPLLFPVPYCFLLFPIVYGGLSPIVCLVYGGLSPIVLGLAERIVVCPLLFNNTPSTAE